MKKNKFLIKKVVSLFDGISCARVALEKNKFSVKEYYASEIDLPAIKISLKNFPDIKHVGGVQTFNKFNFPHLFDGSVDLLIGGSPCQDLSIAKKNRKGLDGERSGLFWEYVRILREMKPKYFILENVNSMPKDAKDLITKTLGVEPIMINAALVSAQNRKRLFWTNIPSLSLPEDREIYLKDILEKDVPFDKYGVELKKSNTIRTSGRGSGVDDKHNWDTIRIASINKGGQGDRIYSPDGKSVALSANGGGRGAKTGLYAIPVALRNRGKGKRPEYNGTSKANAMTTVQTDSMVEVNTQIRRLTPIECERLQGLPDNYTDGVSQTQRYKSCGNAFNVDVITHILSFIKD
jgi:DNA (cytosine-5)-methyltransferase 3A